MKIPQNLLHFISDKALLVVLERKNGIFYFAHNDKLVKVGQIKVELASYSDREGFFVNASGGEIYGSGVPYTDNKEYLKAKFIKNLHDKLDKLVQKHDAKHLYIFAPRDTVPHILGGIVGDAIKDSMIKNVFFGNMSNKHPIKLVEMIKKHKEKRAKAAEAKNISKEANKILKKAKKAKKVIGKNYQR